MEDMWRLPGIIRLTSALLQAEIASSGIADSILKAAHLKRTRHAHQVSALALSKLQHDAFLLSDLDQDEGAEEAWRLDAIAKSPTFDYWDTVLDLNYLD